MQTELKPVLGRLSTQASDIAAKFMSLAIGETVSCDEVSKLAGVDCRPLSEGRRYVSNAINYVRRNHLIVMRWDREASGWVRANNSQTVEATKACKKSANRKLMKALEISKCVRVADLAEEEVVEHRATVTQIGLGLIATGEEFRKSIPKADVMIDTERLLLSLRAVN